MMSLVLKTHFCNIVIPLARPRIFKTSNVLLLTSDKYELHLTDERVSINSSDGYANSWTIAREQREELEQSIEEQLDAFYEIGGCDYSG